MKMFTSCFAVIGTPGHIIGFIIALPQSKMAEAKDSGLASDLN